MMRRMPGPAFILRDLERRGLIHRTDVGVFEITEKGKAVAAEYSAGKEAA